MVNLRPQLYRYDNIELVNTATAKQNVLLQLLLMNPSNFFYKKAKRNLEKNSSVLNSV